MEKGISLELSELRRSPLPQGFDWDLHYRLPLLTTALYRLLLYFAMATTATKNQTR